MNQQVKKKPPIKWQKPNVGVMYALIPAIIASIYYFGWRSLLLLIVVTIAGFITEFIFLKVYYKEPVSSAVFVSCFLFTLALPPTIPIWIAILGIVFGILFGKMVFGGFGRNIFNPALTGRAFIYISFGAYMNAGWVDSFRGFPGGAIALSWLIHGYCFGLSHQLLNRMYLKPVGYILPFLQSR